MRTVGTVVALLGLVAVLGFGLSWRVGMYPMQARSASDLARPDAANKVSELLENPHVQDLSSQELSMGEATVPADGGVVDANADSDGASDDEVATFGLGCIGWSEKLAAALCVVGDYTNECFTHQWDWSVKVIPSGQLVASDSGERTPEERDKNPEFKESRDHIRVPAHEVNPTIEEGKYESSFHSLATLEPRKTLDLLVTTQEGKPPQWLRFRWLQTNSGSNRISMRCLPAGHTPPELSASGMQRYETSLAPPLPNGIRGTEVDLFAYEGSQRGSLSIMATATKTSMVAEHREDSSEECQRRESHSVSVINLARGCTATSEGSAASGLRNR